MIDFPDSPFLVPFDGGFSVSEAPTEPEARLSKKRASKALAEQVERLRDLQRRLYAQDRYAVLLIFQAMDAAGKDSTIRAVMTGINPAGCQVFSFKKPSTRELDHDFLWRTAVRMPERGRIGVFNRSYYEEVLVVRVHPELLRYQRLPEAGTDAAFWEGRYASIREHEAHLARNGTLILKFWLNVSQEEQKRRFLDRLEDPRKNWKFAAADLEESRHWPAYMEAYQEALLQTSRSWAPWYAIPADDKPTMRLRVAELFADALASLDLAYPQPAQAEKERFEEYRRALRDEVGP
ncbi:MAG: polyphosphate kinase 2 family protein [Myxococcales bacterium]|nr:polyphosphate kinase 2 family protein [Myxococcales bacterium]